MSATTNQRTAFGSRLCVASFSHPFVSRLALATTPPPALVKQHVTLQNTSAKRICFKVKTTSPKEFCIKPNCGFLEAVGSEESKLDVLGAFGCLRRVWWVCNELQFNVVIAPPQSCTLPSPAKRRSRRAKQSATNFSSSASMSRQAIRAMPNCS